MSEMQDFFLVSTEGFRPDEPRRCSFVRRLHSELRDDLMLVTVYPPLIGQPFGVGGCDISELVLGTRHQGQTLFPISEWPSYVYCARIVSGNPEETGFISHDGITVLDWAALYPTEEEARCNRLPDTHKW